jgi:Mce-associated membrane protein
MPFGDTLDDAPSIEQRKRRWWRWSRLARHLEERKAQKNDGDTPGRANPPPACITGLNTSEALALAAEAEKEAAEAEARAAAARARAQAIRLRRQGQPGSTVGDEREKPNAGGPAEGETAPRSRRRRRVWAWVVWGCTWLLIGALLAASGYMVWHHRQVLAEKHRAAEFAAEAKEGAVRLTTLDFNNAQNDVQRVLDRATGQFRADFEERAEYFTKSVQESKVVTKGSVQAVAVEKMTDDSAVVLVAATSEVTNASGAQKEPRTWRLSITMTRDGGQLKMSKVEFVR